VENFAVSVLKVHVFFASHSFEFAFAILIGTTCITYNRKLCFRTGTRSTPRPSAWHTSERVAESEEKV
jgi:hypothetical protein